MTTLPSTRTIHGPPRMPLTFECYARPDSFSAGNIGRD